MNTSTGDAQKYPLPKEEIRRKRVARDRERLEGKLRGLEYERRELVGDLKRVQNTYVVKLERILQKSQSIVENQKKLLRNIEVLMQETGFCVATMDIVAGHRDDSHNMHICRKDFGHEGQHLCACGDHFMQKHTDEGSHG